VNPGERIFFDDGKFEAKVMSVLPKAVKVKIVRISTKKPFLKPEKGINFPDSDLDIPPPGPDGREYQMVGLDCAIIMNPKVWEASGHVSGFSDPRFRLSVNLYGAPSLNMKEFPSFQQDLIVGAALQVSVPLGQYDDTRLVNIGTNRWFFKPSLGVSKAMGPWILEGTAAVTFYTDNTDFFRGQTREQDPLYGAEAHVIRSFSRGIWGSIDATYFTGGSTTVNDVAKRDLHRAGIYPPIDVGSSLSRLMDSGIVRISRYCRYAQTNARAMPVLPLVGSMITAFGFKIPLRSASAIIATPIRSFTLLIGL
jgi:hypothetical protein